MEANRPSHRDWRRLAKKERRKRLRQKTARERDADAERLRAALERSAEYLNWLSEQNTQEQARKVLEEQEHAEREEMWLEEEVRAQKEWRLHQERKAKARQEQLEQESRIRKEFEAKQEIFRLRKEEDKKLQEEELRRQQEVEKQIDDYIDEGTETPETLRTVTDSQPGKELCPFFTKTGACRYGDTCSRNHRRVCLSKVILIPGFYSHFSLEKNSAEYDTDVALEFESHETRQHFREFYKDVVPELESFGRIKTLKYCCNTEIHLRGNLYVEYYSEREAARAVRKLKGRWYAGRQLNCEFANVKSWRNAVCGMTKCPKGRACNFLHTFRNPHDEYDIKSPPRWAKRANSQDPSNSRRSEYRTRSKWEESTRGGGEEDRNWRWSESPEQEVEHRREHGRHRRHGEDERRRGSRRERRHEETERSSVRSCRNLESSERSSCYASLGKFKSSERSRVQQREEEDEEENDNDIAADGPGKSSSRRQKDRSRRRRSERLNDENEPEEEKRMPKSDDNRSHRSKRDRRSRTRGKTSCKDRTGEHRNSKDNPTNSKMLGRTAERLGVDAKNVKQLTRHCRSRSKWDYVEASSDPESDSRLNYSDSSTNDEKETGSPSEKRRRLSGDSDDG